MYNIPRGLSYFVHLVEHCSHEYEYLISYIHTTQYSSIPANYSLKYYHGVELTPVTVSKNKQHYYLHLAVFTAGPSLA